MPTPSCFQFFLALRLIGKCLLKGAFSIVLALGIFFAHIQAEATTLPKDVRNHLKTLDPDVKIRFDGLVLFSNGESYIPVLPQDDLTDGKKKGKIQVQAVDPPGETYPDWIAYDNNLYLLRLVQTTAGRLTVPRRSVYPIVLKQGLLPQDFVLPNNLFLPVELKVILGSLPYNPVFKPGKPELKALPDINQSSGPFAEKGQDFVENAFAGEAFEKKANASRAELTDTQNRLTEVSAAYTYDLNTQKLLQINPKTGLTTSSVDIGCAPASIALASNQQLLYMPCLSTDELVVFDTAAELVKTRIKTGKRPTQTAIIKPSTAPNTRDLLVTSNRFSPFLSVVDAVSLTPLYDITLESSAGAIAVVPQYNTEDRQRRLLAADAFDQKLMVVNIEDKLVERTMKAVSDLSDLKILPSGKMNNTPKTAESQAARLEIWALSRSKHKLAVIDYQSGETVATIDMPKKPVSMVVYKDSIFVLSAEAANLTAVSLSDKTVEETISLPEGSFPSAMQRAGNILYIVPAASDELVTVDLRAKQVLNKVPVLFRAGSIALQFKEKETTENTLEESSSSVSKPGLSNRAFSDKANAIGPDPLAPDADDIQ
ncbi:MAG: hypothetical protein AAGI66_08085 [Cyanobacteria bacterium P01_H01_bin.74]